MVQFELVTLDGVKHSGKVYEVQLPTPDGYIAVFEHHAALISLSTPGMISIRRTKDEPDDMMERFASNGGVIEVTSTRVRVLVDEADAADELNQAEIEAALERAKKMRAEAGDQVSLQRAQQLVDRQTVRLQVASLRRRRRHKS